MVTLYTITIFIALFFQAFFTASEMSFTSISRIQLKSMIELQDPNALKLSEFLNKKGAFLGTTLVGTNICVVVASTLVTRIFAEYFGANLSSLFATLVLVPVTLVFAEIIPKMIGRQFSTGIALRTVGLLNKLRFVFSPIIFLVTSVGRILLFRVGKAKTPWELTFTKRDLKGIILSGKEAGEVEHDEAELIHKVLDFFGAKTVEDIMIPLYRVSSVSAGDSVENLKRLVSVTGFSRIPVYQDNKEDIVGVVNIYDILFAKEENGRIVDFLRDPVHVKKSDGIDIALTRLRRRKQPMGIVKDKDQKVVGIVTIEDILEEIVGEIEEKG